MRTYLICLAAVLTGFFIVYLVVGTLQVMF